MNSYGRFGEWESVFSPPAKQPAYRSRNDHFSHFSAPVKFPPEIRIGPVNVRMSWPFLDVSENEKANCSFRRNGWLSLRKWSFLPTFRHLKIFSTERRNGRVPVRNVNIVVRFKAWEIIFSPQAKGRVTFREISFSDVSAIERFLPKKKRPGSRSRGDHFWKFRSLRKSILPSGEMAGLPFSKWPFFPSFPLLKNSLPKYDRPVSHSRSDNFSNVSEPEKAYSCLRRTCRPTLREWPFFDVSASEIFSRKSKWSGSGKRCDHFLYVSEPGIAYFTYG
jgi:hypothetical protein